MPSPSPLTVPTTMLGASAHRGAAADSKAAEAHRRIRSMIVSLELPPASVLDEDVLARTLDMGVTPVRQALRRLAWENLVVILPRRGTLVADLNPADLERIYELRVELEGLAASLAATRATPADREALRDVEERTRAAVRDAGTDHRALIGLDEELHRLLYRAARNPFLEQTLDWTYGHVLRLWNVSLHRVDALRDAVDEHVAIAAAVRGGDAAAAGERMRAHVGRFHDAFRRA